MSVVERDLTDLVVPPGLSSLQVGDELTSFALVSGPETRHQGFQWKLDFPYANAYRIILTGPDRPRPPHDNVRAPPELCTFKVLSFDKAKSTAVFSFPDPSTHHAAVSGLAEERLELRLSWSYQLFSEVWQVDGGAGRFVIRDLRTRSYGLTEHGMIRHWALDRSRLHLGLGEKSAPIDLTGRRFILHATDAAAYDSYRTDPLYKHTPFLVSTPRPDRDGQQGLTYAIFHGTNSVATWDVGGEIDFPSGGYSKRFLQDWGGLEEWVMFGRGVEGVVNTFAEMAGRPRLVGRDWLGYLGSTMLLADKENAQELIEEWPDLCRKHDIPCSAMHLSSGFTADEETNSRWVFHMNKKRYPNFKGMTELYHRAGMKIVPNVKPYVLTSHPAYERLKTANALFYDPISKGPSRQNIWSAAAGESGDGSWVDMSSPEGRKWWSEGVKGLIDLGVDGMWDDNNEYFVRDDELFARNEFDYEREVICNGPIRTGLIGRIAHNELVNKVSHDTLEAASPERRTFVLTRSGNVGAFKYACSTWTGDNNTSWHNMRGSQHMLLNSGISLIQNNGDDVGGFCGDIPSPELFIRWVQLGATHSRFCIHSGPNDDEGNDKLNTPWMYPELLPAIRKIIKWRYFLLPFLNHLNWRSHLYAAPSTAPLFYGPFSTDPALYTDSSLEGFDAWLGVGQLLVAPQLVEGELTRTVYLPKVSLSDQSLYFDLHAPFRQYTAGDTVTVATPIEHGALFAREGAVIPVGKDTVTVTALSGPARTYQDGVDTILDSEGGQVGLDNWRGVQIFPGCSDITHTGEWIEDDGISANPGTYTVKISYSGSADEVKVAIRSVEEGFKPLWQVKIHVLLPIGDKRGVIGATHRMWRDRDAWVLDI